jgi:hypothetical protein
MEVLGVLLEIGTEFLYIICMKLVLQKFNLTEAPKMLSSQFLHNTLLQTVILQFSPGTFTAQFVSSCVYTSFSTYITLSSIFVAAVPRCEI